MPLLLMDLSNWLEKGNQYQFVKLVVVEVIILLPFKTIVVQENIKLSLTGIDIKAECIAFAKSRKSISVPVEWIINDYRKADFDKKPDIIFSSLFCHHFNNEELIFQIEVDEGKQQPLDFLLMTYKDTFSLIIPLKLLTTLFSSSYLVKNDAPLSVLRGFTAAELRDLVMQSQAANATIKWKWAFRYLVTFIHG